MPLTWWLRLLGIERILIRNTNGRLGFSTEEIITLVFIFLNKGQQRRFQCTIASGSLNPIRWEDFSRYGTGAAEKFPMKTEIMWYPSANLRRSRFVLKKIEVALYHYFVVVCTLPASFVVDTFAVLRWKKPFLVSVYFELAVHIKYKFLFFCRLDCTRKCTKPCPV